MLKNLIQRKKVENKYLLFLNVVIYRNYNENID